MRGLAALVVVAATIAVGCAPRLRTLPGAPSPLPVPRGELAPGHHRIVFRWEMQDPDMSTRGEGAARLAAPDSARLDFFLAGGIASGAAVLIGNELRLPSGTESVIRRLVPSPPMLWATLGRVAVPVMRDTVVRVDGDTLRADIGIPTAWRLTFVRDTLRRIERVDGGRVAEWALRDPGDHLRYRDEFSRRQLDLYITRIDTVSAFDPGIWALP